MTTLRLRTALLLPLLCLAAGCTHTSITAFEPGDALAPERAIALVVLRLDADACEQGCTPQLVIRPDRRGGEEVVVPAREPGAVHAGEPRMLAFAVALERYWVARVRVSSVRGIDRWLHIPVNREFTAREAGTVYYLGDLVVSASPVDLTGRVVVEDRFVDTKQAFATRYGDAGLPVEQLEFQNHLLAPAGPMDHF